MTSIKQIQQMVGSREQTYNEIRQVYYLPSLCSKVISISYLREIIKDDCQYLKVKNSQISPVYVPQRFYDREQLLEKLEFILQKNEQKPTGFQKEAAPDLDWLYHVINYFDAAEFQKLFNPKSSFEESVIENYDQSLSTIWNKKEKLAKNSICNLDESQKKKRKMFKLENKLLKTKLRLERQERKDKLLNDKSEMIKKKQNKNLNQNQIGAQFETSR